MLASVILISMTLIYRSMKHPKRVLKYVLVKIDKFIFLVDFIFFLDVKENHDIRLILNSYFLATGRTLINV
jgi:hypothetical protein